MNDEFRDHDAPRPTTGFAALTSLEIDVRVAVMEYADVAAEYADVVFNPWAPTSARKDYAIVVDILDLARRLPPSEIPAMLVVGTRALRRVHAALVGDTDEEAAAA